MPVNPNDPVIMDRTKLEREVRMLREIVTAVSDRYPFPMEQLTLDHGEVIDRAIDETRKARDE